MAEMTSTESSRNVSLDVTGERFEAIDFSEALVFCDLMRTLPSVVQFQAWGLTLCAGPEPGAWLALELEPHGVPRELATSDLYVAGLATITLQGVQGGSVELSLHDESAPDGIARSYLGKSLSLRRQWDQTKGARGYEYALGGTFDWPRATAHLEFYADGAARIDFFLSDLLSVRQYLAEPKKYKYPGAREDAGGSW
jgi:hypothetical protein